MEVKVNKEIRNYKEKIYFGMTFRQFLYCIGGVGAGLAVGIPLYRCGMNTDLVTYVAILVCAPFAILGFANYHGMYGIKLIKTVILCEFIFPKMLKYKSSNLYKEQIKKLRKEEKTKNQFTLKKEGTKTIEIVKKFIFKTYTKAKDKKQ